MITLMTGLPGSGKTAKMVADMAAIKDRPIFVMGIPDLKVNHEIVPPVSEWTRQEPSKEDASLLVPVFNFPENALIVIDEAQNVYRPRPTGSKVPDIVAAFETHRHEGIDFWLITQHPSLLDANIRRLVGKHFHVHMHPLGRTLMEWAGARNPDEKSDRMDAVSQRYSPPKKAFKLYKSSQLHTKQTRRFPWIVLGVVILVIFAIFLSTRIYSSIAARQKKPDVDQLTKKEGETKDITGSPQKPVVNAATEGAFVPVDPSRPESAPIYAQLAQVKDFPKIQGCILTEKTCKCITQQDTNANIPIDSCVDWVKSRRFDPYRDLPNQVSMPNPISSSPPIPNT